MHATAADLHPGARRASRTMPLRMGRLRLSRQALATGLALAAIAAVVLRLQALTSTAAEVDRQPPARIAAQPLPRPAPQPALAIHTTTAEGVALLRRYALNALLLPLLDDAEPPRWSLAAIDLTCGPGTRVLVDGRPLQPGTPVPAAPFRVQWQMDGCHPLGADALALDGGVLLTVYPAGSRLQAQVQPQHLLVAGADGQAAVAGGFDGSASLH